MAREPVLHQNTSDDLAEVLILLQRSDLKPDDRFNSIAFRFNRLAEERREEVATLLPAEIFSRRPEFLRYLPPERRAREILEVIHSGPKAEIRTALSQELCRVLRLLPPDAAQVVWVAAFPDVQFDERVANRGPEKRAIASLGNRMSAPTTPEAVKRGAERLADILQHPSRTDREALVSLVPKCYWHEPAIFALLSPTAQALAARSVQADRLDALIARMSEAGKILTAYRLAQQGAQLPKDLELPPDEKLAQAAYALLWAKDRPKQREEAFTRAHTLLQGFVAERALTSTESLDLFPLLPRCPAQVVTYCEARAWPFRAEERHGAVQVSQAYCPRLNLPCTPRSVNAHETSRVQEPAEMTQEHPQARGARLHALPMLPWQDWSLLELLAVSGVEPDLPGIRSSHEPLPLAAVYVLRLSGWVNRLNEIRERLKCSRCAAIMTPNYAYALNLAAYNSTVVSCLRGADHDRDVYLSHCWACGNIIDSREAKERVDGFYLCRQCGSGPQHDSTFRRGDRCPNCGTPRMIGTDNLKTCQTCRHQIRDPKHTIEIDRRRKALHADPDHEAHCDDGFRRRS